MHVAALFSDSFVSQSKITNIHYLSIYSQIRMNVQMEATNVTGMLSVSTGISVQVITVGANMVTKGMDSPALRNKVCGSVNTECSIIGLVLMKWLQFIQ